MNLKIHEVGIQAGWPFIAHGRRGQARSNVISYWGVTYWDRVEGGDETEGRQETFPYLTAMCHQFHTCYYEDIYQNKQTTSFKAILSINFSLC